MKKSNFELLRIIAMLLVVLVHTNYYSLGEVSHAALISSPAESLARMFGQQTCIICVNVYILISGWFGIRPSFKGGMSIFFQVLFWGCVAYLFHEAFALKHGSFDFNILRLGASYWFVRSYIILYALSPLLNAFVEKASRQQFVALMGAFYVLQLLYGWPKDLGEFHNGYSPLSFFWLYLLARYLRTYPSRLNALSAKHNFSLYLFTTFVATLFSALLIWKFGKTCGFSGYNSPFVILASAFFFLAFSKMDFQSKAVNWLGCSTFSVYLFHINSYIAENFVTMMKSIYDSTSIYLLVAVLIALSLLLACCVVDKVRIFLWKHLCRLVWPAK